MNRFFLEEQPAPELGAPVRFAIDDVGHIARVLRLRPGEKVLAVLGGAEYLVELQQVSGIEVTGRVISWERPRREPPLDVILVQGLPKGDKMDLIVQKATELGVAGVIPMRTERAIVQLDERKAAERQRRWQKIAREAAQQSGRLAVPQVLPVCSLGEALAAAGGQEGGAPPAAAVASFFLWEAEQGNSLKQRLRSMPPADGTSARRVYLFVGPEGGFSPAEAAQARAAGVLPVSLGPRILRTETAGPAAVALVLYEWGDLGGPN